MMFYQGEWSISSFNDFIQERIFLIEDASSAGELMLSPHHRVGYLSCNSEDADIHRPCFLCHVYFQFILFILISLVIYSICNPPDKMSSSYLIYSPLPQQSPGNNFFIYIYTLYNGTLFPSVMETLKTCFHKIHDSHQARIHLVASNLEIDLLHFSRNRCPGYFL